MRVFSVILPLVLIIVLAGSNYLQRYAIGPYNYQSLDGGFSYVCYPAKGRDYEMMMNSLDRYREENNVEGEIQLYRLERRNFLKFWMWEQYLVNPYWTDFRPLPIRGQ